MIIYQTNNRVFRFDYTPTLAQSDISISTITEVGCGYNDDTWWIMVKWRINGLDQTNEEIIGYLAEKRTIIERDSQTIEQDIVHLERFLYNSFINVEMAFQEKLRLPYNVFGKPKDRPNFEENAKNLFAQLTQAGFYK